MSWRHRHFSVRPARMANIACGEDVSARSPECHAFDFATAALGPPRSPRLAEADYRLRRRRWIVTAGEVSATTPMWTSRTSWSCQVANWAASPSGQRVLRDVHLTPRLFARVSAALARFADGTTGRHCAVTNARIAVAAGCSPRTVTTARAVLAQADFAVEVRRGTGSAATPVHQCRPSVWHLTSRRKPVDNTPFCDLPRSRRVTGSVSLGSTLPSVAQGASPGDSSMPKRRQRRHATPLAPRSLHTQRLAGWLASTSTGLGARTGHHVVGQLCDALQASHLDLAAWTGPELVAALNSDMKRRNLTWPDQIHRPGPFLAQRLRHLPERPVARKHSPTIAVGEPSETPPLASVRPLPSTPSQAQLDARRRISEILLRRPHRADPAES